MHRIFGTPFARIYPLLLEKVVRKGRKRDEPDAAIRWLTGYSAEAAAAQIERGVDLRTFFAEAPAMNPARDHVKGTVCGVRVETITDPLMRDIRTLDKLVDELAKGRPLSRVLGERA